MSDTMQVEGPKPLPTRIANFPISFFAIVMGFTGLVIATQKVEESLEITDVPSTVLLAVDLLILLVLTVMYAVKLIRHRPDVAREFNDPVRLSFFPAFSVSLLLVSRAFLPLSPAPAVVFWIIVTELHLILTLIILSIWVQQPKFEIKHMNPVWFIPVVGNLLVPVAGGAHAPREISWFFFSVGVVFWLVLQTLFFYRIFFHHPLPEKLLPTFFILLAPPAVGFIAYVKLTGDLDSFAQVLYFFAVFVFLFLLVQMRMLRRVRFFLSWWAYSFPLAALTIASALMYNQTEKLFFHVLSLVVFAVLIVVICTGAVVTVWDVRRAQICVED
jgi:tellurite resistance protein